MWKVEYSPRAAKAMRKLDRQVTRRVFDAIERLATLDDPTSACKALTGNLSGFWRLRAGDWRAVVDIRRGELIILTLDVGHRSKIYVD